MNCYDLRNPSLLVMRHPVKPGVTAEGDARSAPGRAGCDGIAGQAGNDGAHLS